MKDRPSAFPADVEARQVRVLELWTDGIRSTAAVAEEIGVTPRQVLRIWMRLGLKRATEDPRRSVDWDRIRILVDEGMPSTWIAEDYGLDPQYVADKVRGWRPSITTEWGRAWQYIRRRKELRLLHDEFAPPTLNQAKTLRQANSSDRFDMSAGKEKK